MTTDGAASADPVPPSAPHEAVRALEGRWTIRGKEETFTEICELFPGGHHLVCYATSQNGERVGRHMSIITWSAEEGCYLYFGIGSSVSVRTHRAELDGDVWSFKGSATIEGIEASVRVVMAPTHEGFHFLEQHSVDGETWITDSDFDYIRLVDEA